MKTKKYYIQNNKKIPFGFARLDWNSDENEHFACVKFPHGDEIRLGLYLKRCGFKISHMYVPTLMEEMPEEGNLFQEYDTDYAYIYCDGICAEVLAAMGRRNHPVPEVTLEGFREIITPFSGNPIRLEAMLSAEGIESVGIIMRNDDSIALCNGKEDVVKEIAEKVCLMK